MIMKSCFSFIFSYWHEGASKQVGIKQNEVPLIDETPR